MGVSCAFAGSICSRAGRAARRAIGACAWRAAASGCRLDRMISVVFGETRRCGAGEPRSPLRDRGVAGGQQRLERASRRPGDGGVEPQATTGWVALATSLTRATVEAAVERSTACAGPFRPPVPTESVTDHDPFRAPVPTAIRPVWPTARNGGRNGPVRWSRSVVALADLPRADGRETRSWRGHGIRRSSQLGIRPEMSHPLPPTAGTGGGRGWHGGGYPRAR